MGYRPTFHARWNNPLWEDVGLEGPDQQPAPVPLEQWAQDNHYSLDYAWDVVVNGKLYGIKIKGRWWVYPHTWAPSPPS